ncbi:hypothetical protein NHQ30_005065 [Ciborinia camelliae]|nr:hypothetical protein NHQ30_005065 [Ciborinia camelliae]
MDRTQAIITDNDKTPLVEIFVYILLAISFLTVLARLATKLGVLKKLEWDDHLTTISLAEYASDLLFIASLCFAKMSVIIFLLDLTPITLERRASQLLGLVILLWAISSMIATSFHSLTNTSVIIAVAFQLSYSNKPIVNPAFDLWPAAIITQIVQCLSVVTACFPYIKPFLSSLESGMMRADDLRRRGGTQTLDSNKYYIHTSEGFSGLGGKRSMIRRLVGGKLESRKIIDTVTLSSLGPVDATSTVETGDANVWDGQSQTSESRIIRKTRSWNVDVQRTEDKGTSIASE